MGQGHCRGKATDPGADRIRCLVRVLRYGIGGVPRGLKQYTSVKASPPLQSCLHPRIEHDHAASAELVVFHLHALRHQLVVWHAGFAEMRYRAQWRDEASRRDSNETASDKPGWFSVHKA